MNKYYPLGGHFNIYEKYIYNMDDFFSSYAGNLFDDDFDKLPNLFGNGPQNQQQQDPIILGLIERVESLEREVQDIKRKNEEDDKIFLKIRDKYISKLIQKKIQNGEGNTIIKKRRRRKKTTSDWNTFTLSLIKKDEELTYIDFTKRIKSNIKKNRFKTTYNKNAIRHKIGQVLKTIHGKGLINRKRSSKKSKYIYYLDK